MAIRNGTVAFAGSAGATSGVYTANVGSSPLLVAGTGTAAAGAGGGSYTGFESPSIDAAGNVAFVATTTSGQGVYARVGGNLEAVADRTTVTPGVPATTFNTFTFKGGVAIDDGRVAFSAFSNGNSQFGEGIYTNHTGTLSRVADRSTVIPGSGSNFVFFSRPDYRNGEIVFTGGNGSGGRNGVYAVSASGGSVTRVADQTTPLPGGSTFSLDGTIVRGPSLDAGRVAVFSINNNGYYDGTTAGDPLGVIANGTTTPAGSANPFTSFDMASLSGGRAAVFGSTGDTFRIYSDYFGNGFDLVVAPGQILDGKSVSSVRMGRWAFDGDQIAFRAPFTDGSSGIYVATAPVPEPLGVLAACTATLCLGRRLRGRRSDA